MKTLARLHCSIAARIRSGLRLKSHARLRLQQLPHIGPKATSWSRSITQRTSDGSVAQILRPCVCAKCRWHRQPTMSWPSARYAQLIKICRRRGCPREDARELVQEAHLRLYEYQRFSKVRDADALLRHILINLSISRYNRQRTPPSANICGLDRRGLLVDAAPCPERSLYAEQELKRVARLLSAVSQRTCQVFIAQRGGYTYEEIAIAFAIKPRTVEKHIASALLALSKMMPRGFAVLEVVG